MAATDPVRQIKTETFDHPVQSDLNKTMHHLAALEPSTGTRYLTAALDWRPEGNDPYVRQAVTEARRTIERAISEKEKRSLALQSLTEDLAEATQKIQETLDPSAKGVFVVANSAMGVLEVEALGLPIATSVTLAPIPALKALARMVEDFPLHAILQIDQHEALLSFVSEGLVPELLTVRSSDWPRHQSAGALNQRRYQNRAKERMQAFAKVVVDETQAAMDEAGARRLILSASDVMRPHVMEAMHHDLEKKLIGDIRIDIEAPFDEVLALARPVKNDFERKREMEQVEGLTNAIPEGNGVSGTRDVLNALRNGQASRVVMTRGYQELGWMDYSMQVFGIGALPSQHPAGGDLANVVEVPLEEEIIRQAIVSKLEIEIVKGSVPVQPDEEIPEAGKDAPRSEAGQRLDQLGGVGALLRYTI